MHPASRCRRSCADEFAELLCDAMANSHDVALDRARRLVNEAPLRPWRPADRPPTRPARGDRRLCAALPRARSWRWPAWRRPSSRRCTVSLQAVSWWSSASAGSVSPCRLDARFRSRHNLSAHGWAGRCLGRKEAAGAERLFQPLSQPHHGRPQRSDCRLYCFTTSTPGFVQAERRECLSSRSTPLSNTSETRRGPGSTWRFAGRDRFSARPARMVGTMIEGILELPRDRAKVVADAANRMRTDIKRHKPPKSALDVKSFGPGGLVDLEFAVHVLQLTTGVGLDTRLEMTGSPCGRKFGAGKYCRSAKIAVENARYDASRGARRRQADAGDVANGRASMRSSELGCASCGARRSTAEHRRALEQDQRGFAMINEGDKAPAMTVTSTDGSSVDLAVALPGQPLVLYFYPEGRIRRAAPARRRTSPHWRAISKRRA